MRYQFIFRHAGCLRVFDSTLRALAGAGHEITLIYNLEDKSVGQDLTKLLLADCPNISQENGPVPVGPFSLLVSLCSGSIDYLRYKNPLYQKCPKLVQRAKKRIERATPLLSKALDLAAAILGWQRAIFIFQKCLEELPVDQQIVEYLKERPSDVTVLSPLVDFGSEQIEYLRAAKALERITVLLVHSWDNLTNKGLIRVIPNYVLVWNRFQADEAVRMHGVPASSIRITGAQCYDVWYDMKPTESREDFCRKVGLDPSKRFVLFAGSSKFISADHELSLVNELRAAIQKSQNDKDEELQFLVRPHPQNASPWEILKKQKGLAIYPQGGALPVEQSARRDYFHSIFYSCGVVGVNTSAMIESSILQRPVFTVLDDRFHETQQGTLHFHHLLNSGNLLIAENPEALANLFCELIKGNLKYEASATRFLSDFVRPHSAGLTSTQNVIHALESFLQNKVMSANKSFKRRSAITFMAYGMLPFLKLLAKKKTGAKYSQKKKTAPSVIKKEKSHKKISSNIAIEQGAQNSWKEAGPRNFYIKAIKNDEALLLKKLKRNIGNKRVIIGPWQSEVGFEILYWVPFLRWLVKSELIEPSRATIITRGGAKLWYQGLYSDDIELYDEYSIEELKERNMARIQECGTEKHIQVSQFDQEIIEKHAGGNKKEYSLLHPKELYLYLQAFLAGKGGRAPMETARRVLLHQRIVSLNNKKIQNLLPEKYVVAKFYFRSSFPDVPENRKFIFQRLEQLSRNNPVVLLNTGQTYDDHIDWDTNKLSNLIRIDHLIQPENNLEVQSEVIAGASAFYGTYGGLSYVPLFYGVPSFSFQSSGDGLNLIHLHLAHELARKLEVPFHVFDVKDYEIVRQHLLE